MVKKKKAQNINEIHVFCYQFMSDTHLTFIKWKNYVLNIFNTEKRWNIVHQRRYIRNS